MRCDEVGNCSPIQLSACILGEPSGLTRQDFITKRDDTGYWFVDMKGFLGDGIGLVSVPGGSADETGTGTVFTDDDVSRRIIMGGITSVIKTVTSAEVFTQIAPYTGNTASDIGYATGGKLV